MQITLQGGLNILKQADMRPVLSGLTIPVSVILGGLDTLVPVAVGQKMQQLLPELGVKYHRQGRARAVFVAQPGNAGDYFPIYGSAMQLDKAKIRQSFAAASVTYDGVASIAAHCR